MWRNTARKIYTDVSEKSVAYNLDLNVEAVGSSETSVPTYQIIRLHIPDYSNLNSHRRQNLKSHNVPTWWSGLEKDAEEGWHNSFQIGFLLTRPFPVA
jgi:hypothetical protein